MSTSTPPPEPPQAGGEAGQPPEPVSGAGPSFGAGASPSGPGAGGRRMPAKLLASAGAVAVIVVLALVIFGSSSNNAVDPVAAAATTSANAPGYRMVLSLKISSPALPTALTGSGAGTFSTQSRSGAMTMSMNLPSSAASVYGSSTLTIKEILSGGNIYMQLPPKLMGQLGSTLSKKWIEINFAKLEGVSGLSSIDGGSMSSNPSELLQFLRAASGSVQQEGHAVIDGFQTTRYHANLDFNKIPSAVPAADRAAMQQLVSKVESKASFNSIPVDVWIDSRHLVRQMVMTINATASGQTLAETIKMDIPRYGAEPKPALPPASEVANATSLAGTG
jgi:hypothetical protein